MTFKLVPKLIRSERVASTTWLGLENVHWSRSDGVESVWNRVTRTTNDRTVHEKLQTPDAVSIFTVLHNGNKAEEGCSLILVKQFRPAVGMFTLELPAGLVDEGEDVEKTALRELREETGYSVDRCVGLDLPATCVDPGITDEITRMCVVEIDENNIKEPIVQDLDENEDIEILNLRYSSNMHKELRALMKQHNAIVFNEVHGIVMGISMGFAIHNSNNIASVDQVRRALKVLS